MNWFFFSWSGSFFTEAGKYLASGYWADLDNVAVLLFGCGFSASFDLLVGTNLTYSPFSFETRSCFSSSESLGLYLAAIKSLNFTSQAKA